MIDRYIAVEKILAHVQPDDLVLSTTGMISREVFATDDRPGNFYMIGPWGYCLPSGWGWLCNLPASGCWCWMGTEAR